MVEGIPIMVFNKQNSNDILQMWLSYILPLSTSRVNILSMIFIHTLNFNISIRWIILKHFVVRHGCEVPFSLPKSSYVADKERVYMWHFPKGSEFFSDETSLITSFNVLNGKFNTKKIQVKSINK